MYCLMSDAKLFRIDAAAANEVPGHFVALEKSLQSLLEKHLDAFLSVRFLVTEHPISKPHNGRIDTLGLDENGCPVIIEYKRTLNENVINQGLFYLDWLVDHKADSDRRRPRCRSPARVCIQSISLCAAPPTSCRAAVRT